MSLMSCLLTLDMKEEQGLVKFRVEKKAVWVKEQHVQRPCAGKSLGRGHEAW